MTSLESIQVVLQARFENKFRWYGKYIDSALKRR